MPSNRTNFDKEIERVTAETNTSEDWAMIMQIIDRVSDTESSKALLKSIEKRLQHKIPLVTLQALTILDACIKNCKQVFRAEVATKDFIHTLRTFHHKAHPKVAERFRGYLKKWADEEFRGSSSLSNIPTFYNQLKAEGYDFPAVDQTSVFSMNLSLSAPPTKSSSSQELMRREEEDFAKAIQMSLKEQTTVSGVSSGVSPGGGLANSTSAPSSFYPVIGSSIGQSYGASFQPVPAPQGGEFRKVRALYDFEGVESDELTFKAGDEICILDDGDPNWWKGYTPKGQGLFPANFVTADLNADPTPSSGANSKSKKVKFQENVQVHAIEKTPQPVEINQDKLELVLSMLQNADPTGETDGGDTEELVHLEEECKAMGGLIDAELEKVDKNHMQLMDLNTEVVNALKLYNTLLYETPVQPQPAMYGMGQAQPPQQGLVSAGQQPWGFVQPGSVAPASLPMGQAGLVSVPGAANYPQSGFPQMAPQPNQPGQQFSSAEQGSFGAATQLQQQPHNFSTPTSSANMNYNSSGSAEQTTPISGFSHQQAPASGHIPVANTETQGYATQPQQHPPTNYQQPGTSVPVGVGQIYQPQQQLQQPPVDGSVIQGHSAPIDPSQHQQIYSSMTHQQQQMPSIQEQQRHIAPPSYQQALQQPM